MRRLREGLLARGDNPKAEMPFLDHLEELRWRILWTLLAVIACAVIGLFLVIYYDVVELLIRPANQLYGDDFELIYLAPEAPFFLLLRLALSVGLVLASPVVVYQAWCFFSPALEAREKRESFPHAQGAGFCSRGVRWVLPFAPTYAALFRGASRPTSWRAIDRNPLPRLRRPNAAAVGQSLRIA